MFENIGFNITEFVMYDILRMLFVPVEELSYVSVCMDCFKH